MTTERTGILSAFVRAFIIRNLSPLLILFALAAGFLALVATPREEDPQIVVPMADVVIQMPGFSAEEVERLASTRLEKMLMEIDGVEYVYSMSKRDMAIVTVRFYVGENREDSLIRLYNKIEMNLDRIPPGVTGWVVKPVEIDDVPILAATLYSSKHSLFELRRVAEELEILVQQVPKTGITSIIGGLSRRLTVDLDPEALAARKLTPLDVYQALSGANVTLPAGDFERDNLLIVVDGGTTLSDPDEVRDLVVGLEGEKPVYLRDVAHVTDGPEEITSYTKLGFGRASVSKALPTGYEAGVFYPAVTLAVAKQKGSNAVTVSNGVQKRLEELQRTILPDGMKIAVTRDYGLTANDKVNDLVESLAVAGIVVAVLISFFMGGREALIVITAVPVTFSLTLLVNFIAGYTINRVTLFALILSLGLVVDDPIAIVDNVQRHIRMRMKKPLDATLAAVTEVLPPVILSSLAIIVSFTPMFFITGMMGPYMRPMAINVPLAVTFSTLCALTLVPWLSFLLLRKQGLEENAPDSNTPQQTVPEWLQRTYSRLVGPFLDSGTRRLVLITTVILLFLGAVSLAVFGFVPLKMLPFDNKNELQIVIDMPEGTTLEETAGTADAFAEYLGTVPEVTNFAVFVGLAGPMDFNGLVRHYYLREGGNVADVRINLAPKDRREQQSHAVALRLRNDLTAIAERYGANIKIVETPPGPPVLATITAEIYGAPDRTYQEIMNAAKTVETYMADEPLLVDRDDSIESPQLRYVFRLDKEKAALHGVSTDAIAQTIRLGLEGASPGALHVPLEANPLFIRIQLPRAMRSSLDDLERLHVRGAGRTPVRLSELGRFQEFRVEQTIYHKNLRKVVYLYGEMAGRSPAEAIFGLEKRLEEQPLPPGFEVELAGEGEWKITLDVFRDLGIAFAVAFLGIYILLVYETRSYLLPLVLLIAVPLTIIGIMPGFFLLNLLFAPPVDGFPNPVFFTATAMIGTIALAGIVVRNSVVLITFIRDSRLQGMDVREAILQSGAVRMRPIFLTAATTALSAFPIALDPIFSGLAWALIFGLFVSTAFSLVLVPVVYYMLYRESAP